MVSTVIKCTLLCVWLHRGLHLTLALGFFCKRLSLPLQLSGKSYITKFSLPFQSLGVWWAMDTFPVEVYWPLEGADKIVKPLGNSQMGHEKHSCILYPAQAGGCIYVYTHTYTYIHTYRRVYTYIQDIHEVICIYT